MVADGGNSSRRAARGGGRPFGEVEPRRLGAVEGDAAHGAGVGQHGRAAGLRDRPCGEEQRHVGEGVEAVDHRDPGVGKDGARDREIAGHGASVRLRGPSRRLRAPRLHEDDALVQLPCAGGERQQLPGLPHLLDEQRRHAGRRVLQDQLKEVLRAEHRLVPGADEERHSEPRGDQRIADGVGDGPALGDDGDARGSRRSVRRRHRPVLAEGERHTIDVVDETEAVRPVHNDPGRPRQSHEPLLQRAALRARLSEAGGEDDGAADLAAPAGGDGLEHRLLWDVEDDNVEPWRQLVDGGHARMPADLGPGAADQMEVTREAGPLEVGEHITADRARIVRRADDGDRARPQQARDRGRCGTPRAYGCAYHRRRQRGV